MKVLVTGGAGYVGSVICSALLDNDVTPVVLDSLVTGRNEFVHGKLFYEGDIGDRALVGKIFSEHPEIAISIHCAEKAAVDQSVAAPYDYYINNVEKSIELFKYLCDCGCKKIIFSSSGAIYDDTVGYMVTENSPIKPRSPFAKTKYISEMILQDFACAYGMRCISLRHFNPVGADPKLRSGIQPRNPSGIIGKLLDVANGREKAFKIAGKDWGTRDDTCIRDYVHVWDVAMAFVQAARNFDSAFEKYEGRDGFLPINIGSGIGVTVKEFIFAFENIYGEKINISYTDRRPGDVAGTYANTTRAKNLINWKSTLTIEEAVLDAIRWDEGRR
ncbi:MAG: UDP-glucose 4-epimerase GalE [Clostridiales bacterium]|jgi:UDP-glucose 4-epimerase|nr:UDP-glucose 4-epimerase GalE [Clostridiales bacterium]